MQRSQFVAAIVILAVVVGLFATRLRSGNEEAAPAAQTPDAETAAAEPADADQSTDPDDPGDGATNNEGIQGGEAASTDTSTAAPPADAPPILDSKPPLVDLDGWLQTDATSLDDFGGQVRIVEFWTFGCFNCKNRIPFTQDIYAKWQPKGLEIIGVHAPEFDRERDPDAVANAAIDLGVTWPIALDTKKTNFRNWQGDRRFWPRTFVLDQNGQVRYDHIGEGKYEELESVVAYLIENGP